MKELILVHGALGSKNQFTELKKILDSHFEMHTFDFSGHGGKSCDQPFSIDLFKEDLKIYMENHALEKADIFGYSMGGYVALKLALEHPEKIGRIMTLGTKLDWNPASAAKEMKMLDWKKMQEKIPRFVEILKKDNHPNDWRELVEKTAKMIHGLGNGKAVPMQAFSKLENPVLAAIGSEDNMVTKEETKTLSKILPQGEFLEIGGFKHPIDTVDKQELGKIIIEYFKR